MTDIRKEKCHWKYCRTIIDVDHSRDIAGFCYTVDFCKFHWDVMNKREKIIQRLDKTKNVHDLVNELYLKNRKKYNTITKKAIEIVKRKYSKRSKTKLVNLK